MRLMYDAVNPNNVPTNAVMVAGYVDGRYAWKPADWARFPSAVKVFIAVFPSTNAGQVLDCEAGDATPAQVAGWLTMRRRAGVDPTVYCSLAAWPAVEDAVNASHVAQPHWWIAAHPGNGPNLYANTVAHQYQDVNNLYDLSVVADFWPGVDPVLPPAPQPEVPPMPRQALPAAARPAKIVTAVWKPDGGQWDVVIDGADGHIYHIWWTPALIPGAAGFWSGPEVLDQAG